MPLEKQATWDIFGGFPSTRTHDQKLKSLAPDAGDGAGPPAGGEEAPISDSQAHLRQLFDLSQSQTVPASGRSTGRSRLNWRGSVCSLPLGRECSGAAPSPSESRLPSPASTAAAAGLGNQRPAASVSPSPRGGSRSAVGLGALLGGVMASRPVRRPPGGSWLSDGDVGVIGRISPANVPKTTASTVTAARDKGRDTGPNTGPDARPDTRPDNRTDTKSSTGPDAGPVGRSRAHSEDSDVTEEFLFRPTHGSVLSPRRPDDETPRFNLSDGFSFEEDPPAIGPVADGHRQSTGADRRVDSPPGPAHYRTSGRIDPPPPSARDASSVPSAARPERPSCLPRRLSSPPTPPGRSAYGRYGEDRMSRLSGEDDRDNGWKPNLANNELQPGAGSYMSAPRFGDNSLGRGDAGRPDARLRSARAGDADRMTVRPNAMSLTSNSGLRSSPERPVFDLMSFADGIDSPVRDIGTSGGAAGDRTVNGASPGRYRNYGGSLRGAASTNHRPAVAGGSESSVTGASGRPGERSFGDADWRGKEMLAGRGHWMDSSSFGDSRDGQKSYSRRTTETDGISRFPGGRGPGTGVDSDETMPVEHSPGTAYDRDESMNREHGRYDGLSRADSTSELDRSWQPNRWNYEDDADMSGYQRFASDAGKFVFTRTPRSRSRNPDLSESRDRICPPSATPASVSDSIGDSFARQDTSVSHSMSERDPWDDSDFRPHVFARADSNAVPDGPGRHGPGAPSLPGSNSGGLSGGSRFPRSEIRGRSNFSTRSEDRRDGMGRTPTPAAESEMAYDISPPPESPLPPDSPSESHRAWHPTSAPRTASERRWHPEPAFSPPPMPPPPPSSRPTPTMQPPTTQPPRPTAAATTTPVGVWRPEGVDAPSGLRPVAELPPRYRPVFQQFPYFNLVQSTVMDDALYSDRPLVVCAPTGSGKTVVFELAIINLLMEYEIANKPMDCIVVYMAPMKALCTERYLDWQKKFGPLGLECGELTGDSDGNDYADLQRLQVVLTTPEKWDSVTRRWSDMRRLLRSVRLLLIDEVHLLNDPQRGPTMEAVVSRMKNANDVAPCEDGDGAEPTKPTRFLAISATIPNAEDIGDWLSTDTSPAVTHKLDESLRPVRLRRVVLGYPCSEKWSHFRFDLSLNYKLASVLHTYSEQKPALVFCSTRKGCQQAASVVVREACLVADAEHKVRLTRAANLVTDATLRDLLLKGVGIHHAGLLQQDRHAVEQLFLSSDLPVLICTSTLAMGVNLPAHLVVVKSTSHYTASGCQPYSDAEILQMIGRAGRPQFETSATAVIMTQATLRRRYELLLSGSQLTESCLHRHLIAHINAEVVLSTITDVEVALRWLRSTFLYVRVLRNPTHYGVGAELTRRQVEEHLQDLCMVELNRLAEAGLISKGELEVAPTPSGRLMARFCISFETMRALQQMSGAEDLPEMLAVLAGCGEFEGLQLRTSDKRCLNALNRDPHRTTVRYPLPGRVKTTQMKINCLIQAALGSIAIGDPSLSQDVTKIFRVAERVMRCATEYLCSAGRHRAYLSSALLAKSVRARLWPDSEYVSRQLTGVGPALSTALVNAGLTSLEKIVEAGGRRVELIVNRLPPFGTHLVEAARNLPRYSVTVEQTGPPAVAAATVTVTVTLQPLDFSVEKSTAGPRHSCLLIIGDEDNRLLCTARITDGALQRSGELRRQVNVQRATAGDKLTVSYVSERWVGLDVKTEFSPTYRAWPRPQFPVAGTRGAASTGPDQAWQEETTYLDQTMRTPTAAPAGGLRECRHHCLDKTSCAHACCKQGVPVRNAQERVHQLIRNGGTPARPPPPTPGQAPAQAQGQASGSGPAHNGVQQRVGPNPTRVPPPRVLPRVAHTPNGGNPRPGVPNPTGMLPRPVPTANGVPSRATPGVPPTPTPSSTTRLPPRATSTPTRIPPRPPTSLPQPPPQPGPLSAGRGRGVGPSGPGGAGAPIPGGPQRMSAGRGYSAGEGTTETQGVGDRAEAVTTPVKRPAQWDTQDGGGSKTPRRAPSVFSYGGVRQNRSITDYFPVRKTVTQQTQKPVSTGYPGDIDSAPDLHIPATDEQTPGACGPDEYISDPNWTFPETDYHPEAADAVSDADCGFGAVSEPMPEPEPAPHRSAMKVSEFERRQKTDYRRLDRLYGMGTGVGDSSSGPERHPVTGAVSPTSPSDAPGGSFCASLGPAAPTVTTPREGAPAPARVKPPGAGIGSRSGSGTDPPAAATTTAAASAASAAAAPPKRRSIFSASAVNALESLRQGRPEPAWSRRLAPTSNPSAI